MGEETDFEEKESGGTTMQGGSPARVLGWEPVHRHGDQISGPALSEITSVKEESDDITVELTEMLDLQRCYFEPRDEHHGPPMLLVEETYGFNIATITLWSNARVIELYHTSHKGDTYVGSVRATLMECVEMMNDKVYRGVIEVKGSHQCVKLKFCSLLDKKLLCIYRIAVSVQASNTPTLPTASTQGDWLENPGAPDPAALLQDISQNTEVPSAIKIFLQHVVESSMAHHHHQAEGKPAIPSEQITNNAEEKGLEAAGQDKGENSKENGSAEQLPLGEGEKRILKMVELQIAALEKRLDTRLSALEAKVDRYERLFKGFGFG